MFHYRSLLAIAFVVSTLLAVNACKKENQSPTLTIDKPVADQAISTSDSVLITGAIADDKDLHELYVTVTNATGDTAMHVSPYVHGLQNKTYAVYFAPASTGTYLVMVTVLDHDLAYTQKSVTINAYNAPIVSLQLPIDSSAIPQGAQLQVKGTVTDDSALRYLYLLSVNARSGDTISNDSIMLNGASTYSFNEFITQSTKDTFDLSVTATNTYNFATTKKVRYFVY